MIVDGERIEVRFASGLVASRPLADSRRLLAATATQRSAVQIINGHHLRLGEIDEDIDTTIFLGFAEDLGAASRGSTVHPSEARRPG